MKDPSVEFSKELKTKLEKLEKLLKDKKYKEGLAEIRDFESCQQIDGISSQELFKFYHLKASVLRFIGSYSNALDSATKAFSLVKGTHDNNKIAQTQYVLGLVHISLGDLRNAELEIRDALTGFRRASDLRGMISALNQLEFIEAIRGNYARSVEFLYEALKYCDRVDDERYKAILYGNLGQRFLRMGKWDKAEENLLLNIRLNEKAGDEINLSRGLLSLGYVHFLRRRFRESSEAYEKSIALINKNNSVRDLAIYHEFSGELVFTQSDYAAAKQHYLKAIEIGEKVAPEGDIISESFRLLAELQIAEKQYDKALSSCEKALRVATALGEKMEIGAIHRALGQFYSAKKEKEKAKENFKKAISILEKIKAKYELAKTYLEAGKSNCFDLFDRVQYLGRAKDLFRELDSQYHEGLVQLAISKLFFENEEYEKALLFLNDAERIFKESKEDKELSPTLSFRRILEKASGKLENAIGVKSRYAFSNIITQNQKMQEIIEEAKKIKDSELTILLEGETGTGKDLLAKTIHYESKRKNKKFVVAQCSAIPETLIENALFGHVKGAYTGASENSMGLFQEAGGGTLYLDEIAEIPLSTQVKLLRAIEEKEITRIGETKPEKIDVRIISSTSRNLDERVSKRLFRKDLYFRLNALSFRLPPLRERKEDIRLLIKYFLEENGFDEVDLKILDDAEFIETILGHDWPGNIRELKNEIEKFVTLASANDEVNLDLLEERMNKLSDKKGKPCLYDLVAEFEKGLIIKALKENDWIITKAAEALKLHEASLRTKLKKYGIKKLDTS